MYQYRLSVYSNVYRNNLVCDLWCVSVSVCTQSDCNASVQLHTMYVCSLIQDMYSWCVSHVCVMYVHVCISVSVCTTHLCSQCRHWHLKPRCVCVWSCVCSVLPPIPQCVCTSQCATVCTVNALCSVCVVTVTDEWVQCRVRHKPPKWQACMTYTLIYVICHIWDPRHREVGL